jgi:outer membrane protein
MSNRFECSTKVEMMLTRWAMVLMLVAGAVGWMACASETVVTEPQYRVNRERLENRPPSPLVEAGDAHTSITSAAAIIPVNHGPVLSRENTPTTITALFDGPPKPLGLADVVVQTLGNNRQIKILDHSVRAAACDIPIQQGIYDLTLHSSASFASQKEEPAAGLSGSTVRSRMGEFGLSQLLPSGAQLSVGYDLARLTSHSIASHDQTYDQQSWVKLSQPLLKGFGPTVTNANIRIAQLEHEQSAAGFRVQVEQQLAATLTTYWSLIGAQEAYQVQAGSYRAALDLLRISRIKYRIGKVAEPDVLQAEAAAQAWRDQLILARKNVRLIEDQLKRMMLMDEHGTTWKEQILPTQPVAWQEVQADPDQAIELALERRAELKQATLGIDQAAVEVKVAQNSLLPGLNLAAEGAVHGVDSGFSEAYNDMAGAGSNNYAVGLEVSYPLQNRAARYGLKKARILLNQTEEVRLDVRDQVIQEVRQALLELDAGRERIDVTRELVRNEEAKLNAERKRYDLGASTAYQVIQFQNDQASARLQYVGVVIAYNQAAIQFEQARGTLLESYGVEVAGGEGDKVEETAHLHP